MASALAIGPMLSAPSDRIAEIECLCGGREDDRGQDVPRECHACHKRTMGLFRSSRPKAVIPVHITQMGEQPTLF